MSEWCHKEIVRPFIDALREEDEDVDWSQDSAVDELLHSLYSDSLYSDIDVAPRETVRAFLIDIVKFPSAATESSYEALDLANVRAFFIDIVKFPAAATESS